MNATFRVRTLVEDRPVSGSDSCVATVPPGVYVQLGDQPPALDVKLLGLVLRKLSEDQATKLDEVLHHAEWTITADPGVVEKVGMHGNPDCGRCRASVDQALAHLAEHRQEMLVGMLYWAG